MSWWPQAANGTPLPAFRLPSLHRKISVRCYVGSCLTAEAVGSILNKLVFLISVRALRMVAFEVDPVHCRVRVGIDNESDQVN